MALETLGGSPEILLRQPVIMAAPQDNNRCRADLAQFTEYVQLGLFISRRLSTMHEHGYIPYWYGMAQLRPSRPCRPLFLSRGVPIPSDLSDFPLANSWGNGTYVFEIS
jgi:hypothetical protein